MLASGVVNGTPHLYVGDPTNHRVLDLQILPVGTPGGPTPTATTGTSTVASLTMQPVQQLVSPQFNTLKGIAIDPQGATINILTQLDASHLNVVSASSGPQTVCKSGS